MSQDPGRICGLQRKIEGNCQRIGRDWQEESQDLAAGAGAGACRRCPRTLALVLARVVPGTPFRILLIHRQCWCRYCTALHLHPSDSYASDIEDFAQAVPHVSDNIC